nr:ATP-binding cassette domain-containing protein [Clostridia bacterium]
MIKIENLSKRYGDLAVYNNFNLSLEEGKIIGILGESGSGKTTLLNCIAGLTDFEGNIPKLRCSYVFQTPRLVQNLTVKENLKLICKDENKINEMLSKVRLEDKAESFPIKLSGGQAQRVSLARAFLFDSDIILLDEPLSSLDLRLKKEITDLFISIWQEDKRTAIYVTHDVDEAVSLAHRIIILQRGEILYDKTPEELPPRNINECVQLRCELISQ